VTSQKTSFFIVTAVKTSNLTRFPDLCHIIVIFVFRTLYGVPWTFMDYDRKILLPIVSSYHKTTNQQLLSGFSRTDQYFNVHGLGLLAILSLSFEGDLLRCPHSAMVRSVCEILRNIGRYILNTLKKLAKCFCGKCLCSPSDAPISCVWNKRMMQSCRYRFPSMTPKYVTGLC
jgi:hypothetical protein